MRISRFLVTCVLAAGCGTLACSGRSDTTTTPSPSPPSASGSCDATQAQFAMGQAASADLLERAKTAAGAGSARYLRPNQPITMEFLASRLNLNLNGRDVVDGVRCG